MKKLLLFSIFSLFIFSCSSQKQSEQTATATEEPEWITLFNGENFDGWEMYGPEPIAEPWVIDNGAIACNKDAGEENFAFDRSIMTTEDFDNFELVLEYKIAKGGNSGIFYHVVEMEQYGHDYMTGPEFQVLDDEFSRSETEPIRMVASNYDMHPAASTKKPKPHTEWNEIRLIYNNGHVEHWLNGEKVLEFEEGSDDWNQRKANSKWADAEHWAASKTGRISLQNHGDAVWYRNIRIRRL